MSVDSRTDHISTQVRHGALWSAINTLVMKVASIAITAVVVRIVSPHDFGVFAVALIVYTIVSSVGELGLSSCLSRRDLKPDEIAPTVGALAILSSLGLAGATAVFAGALATTLGAPEAEGPIRVLALSIAVGGITTVPSALLVRNFRQDRLFLATVIAFFPSNGMLVVLALHGDGAMAFAWSRLIGQICAAIVVFTSSKPRYWPRLNLNQILPVLRFGLPLAGANLLNYTLLNTDYAFIGVLLGPALLGVYVLAFNVASWSTSVLGATINSVAMPAFSSVRSDASALRFSLAKSVKIVTVVAFPICAITLVLAADIINFLYGSKWLDASPALVILSIYGTIFVVSLLLSNLLVGIGRTGRVLAIQAVWLASLLPAVALGVSLHGLVGAAFAHLIVVTIVVLPMYLWALTPSVPAVLGLFARAVRGPFAAAILCGIFSGLSISGIEGSGLRLVIGGAVGITLYLVFIIPFIRSEFPRDRGGRLGHLLAAYDRCAVRLSRRLIKTGVRR